MRKIFQNDEQTNALFNQDDNRATKQDIVDLSNQISAVDQKADNIQNELDDLESGLQESVNTNSVVASTGSIGNLDTESIASNTIESNQISGTNANIDNAQISNATISNETVGNLSATIANIDNATIDTETVTSSTIDDLTAENAHISTADIDTANIGTYNTENITATGNLTVAGDSNLGDVTAADIISDSVKSETAEIDEITSTEELVENVTWNGKVSLAGITGPYYITIPHFENGLYAFELKNEGNIIVSVEIFNSIDNFYVRWSKGSVDSLQAVYKIGSGANAQLVFKAELDAEELVYGTTCGTENVPGPSTSIIPPADYTVTYQMDKHDGNLFFRHIDLPDASSNLPLVGSTTSVYADAEDAWVYDGTERIVNKPYKPDQSLNTDDSVEFEEVTTTFLGVRDFSTRNFIATELKTLATIDLTEFDDGALIEVRNNSTAETVQNSTTYIKKTVNNTPVLYPVAMTDGMPQITSNKPLIYDATKGALVEATDLNVSGDLTVTGEVTATGGLADGTTVNGDLNIQNDLSVTGDATADNLNATTNISSPAASIDNITSDIITVENINVSDDLEVHQNAIIHGDLEVRGTTIASDVENVQTESDYIVLRANNPVPLANNDYAGVVVHNYNLAGKDAAITVDNSGTFRLSTQTTEAVSPLTNTWLVDYQYFYGNIDFSQATLFSENFPVTRYDEVFTDIKAYKDGNGNHYFYDPNAATIEYHDNVTCSAQNGIELAGNVVQFTPGPTDASHDVHFYTSISFMEPQASDMEPILTREEEANMADSSLLKWDAVDTKAKTIDLPTNNNQVLTSKVTFDPQDPTTITDIDYEWKSSSGAGGLAFVGTRSAYNVAKLIPEGQTGYIPTGAMVIITDENDYLNSEDK